MQVKVDHYCDWFEVDFKSCYEFIFYIENNRIIKVLKDDVIIYSGKFDTTDDIINFSIIMYIFQATIRLTQIYNFYMKDLIKMIYNIEINQSINFINILDNSIEKLQINRIEDLLKYYSENNKILSKSIIMSYSSDHKLMKQDYINVYEYPDNVIFNINKENNLYRIEKEYIL